MAKMKRFEELNQIQFFLDDVDNEITMLLQSLQWDRNKLISDVTKTACIYNHHHTVPSSSKVSHEEKCFLKTEGYCSNDKLLPEPFDNNSDTIVQLGSDDIRNIIDVASKNDPLFKRGCGSATHPLTVERLQATFTADERHAIHDAVVRTAPARHDLSDLALLDGSAVKEEGKTKSRVEILAELRNMKRRRAKYRVAAKTKNYSDILRDVIKTQMELYTETQTHSKNGSKQQIKNEIHDISTSVLHIKRERSSSTENYRKSVDRIHNHRHIDISNDRDRRPRYDERSRKYDRKSDQRQRDERSEKSKVSYSKSYDHNSYSSSYRNGSRGDSHRHKNSRIDDSRYHDRHSYEKIKYEEKRSRQKDFIKCEPNFGHIHEKRKNEEKKIPRDRESIKREPDYSGY
ncbi:uncharacterized protein LOC126965677 [Leptidea sinapis]|uniref:uncharacterized protein LOC126965677 n=1 Tax=Leptidea sinapis TaxID=189913 RepID=UPI0021C42423|nr:uncharacterized protein LOC126965677 [Leptidea sinapis]